MPTVRVELCTGRSQEQKAEYVKEVTRLTADVLRCAAESVDVIFTEIAPENWAAGGHFFSSSTTKSSD
jgi:4-oxalocrotonate tautomerase